MPDGDDEDEEHSVVDLVPHAVVTTSEIIRKALRRYLDVA